MSDIDVGNTPNLTPPDAKLLSETTQSSNPFQAVQTKNSKKGSEVFLDRLSKSSEEVPAGSLAGGYKTTDVEADEPQVPTTAYATEEEAVQEETETSSVSDVSKWLTVSAKSVIAELMISLAITLRYSRVVELRLRINHMNVFMDLAEHAASMIKEMSRKQAELYKEQAKMGMYKAIAGAVSIGVGAGLGVGAARGSEGARAIAQSGALNSVNTVITGSSEAAGYTAMAEITKEKGRLEAQKELIDGIKNILQQAMQSAFENDKKLSQEIKETLQRAQQIHQQQARAHSTLTQHNQA
jgi:hypothetical protein